jgi:hypothetical protein
MALPRPLLLEPLEDRLVPTTFNVPWPDAPHLTLSFAPDGTDAAGRPSALFRALDAGIPTAVWQAEVLRAFQTWANAANINISLVPDGGEPFASLGLKQGDPRFGDIRIGAFSMAGDTLAVADPYDPFIADTSVGDIFLNSADRFSIGGGTGTYDLFSVLLHEAGHVLGLGGSSDPNSPMFEQYHKVAGLTPGDVANIRALYGPKPAGGASASAPAGNPGAVAPPSTPSPADPLALAQLLATSPGYVEHTYYEGSNSSSAAAPAQTYRVLSPDLGSGLTNVMTVLVTSPANSGIALRALVFDAAGNRVDAAVIADGNGSYEIQVPGVGSARDYFVEVLADRPGVAAAPYVVDIDFGLDGRHLQTFVNDTLDRGTATVARVLQVAESQQFQFVLSASDWGAAATTGVRMTILDASGRAVFSLTAASGASRFAEAFLNRGRYTVLFTRSGGPGAALTPVLFELSGLSTSDSLGPQVRDTTLAAATSASAMPAPSFFFLLPAGAPASRGPAVSGLNVVLVPAAPGPSTGPITAPQSSVQAGAAPLVAALQNSPSEGGDPSQGTAPRAGAPPAVTSAGAGAATIQAPRGAQESDQDTVFVEAEAAPGTAVPDGVAPVAAVSGSGSVAAAGMMRPHRLLWLGLGFAALGWLTHRATWSEMLSPAWHRLVIRKKRERSATRG